MKEEPQTYYWLGFLMADGSFKERQIQIKVSNKDRNHLVKLDDFLGFTGRIFEDQSICRRTYSSKKVVDCLKKKFKISSRKTYSPFFIDENMDRDLFLSLFIGFVDGDGSISKGNYSNLSISCHESWYNNFIKFKNKLAICLGEDLEDFKVYKNFEKRIKFEKEYSSKVSIFRINKNSILKKIKFKAIELNLPIMERKWNNINLQKINSIEKSKLRLQEIKKLSEEGYFYKDIARNIGLGHKYVKSIIVENGYELHDMPRVPRHGEFQTNKRNAGQ